MVSNDTGKKSCNLLKDTPMKGIIPVDRPVEQNTLKRDVKAGLKWEQYQNMPVTWLGKNVSRER